MFLGTDKIIRLHSIGSTNDYMAEQLRNKKIIEEGTVVIAYEQSKGKGLNKNSWESEPGKNITLSILLKPDFLRADQQFMLIKSISLGVYDFVKSYIVHSKISIKWPNDIYLEDKKIAGILISNIIEGNQMRQSIAGIGININQKHFPNHVRNPVSIINVLRKELDLEQVLHELLYCLENRYLQLIRKEFTLISKNYVEYLFRYNQQYFFLYKNETISARITGISEYGHLQLMTIHNEQIECDLKEIDYII